MKMDMTVEEEMCWSSVRKQVEKARRAEWLSQVDVFKSQFRSLDFAHEL